MSGTSWLAALRLRLGVVGRFWCFVVGFAYGAIIAAVIIAASLAIAFSAGVGLPPLWLCAVAVLFFSVLVGFAK